MSAHCDSDDERHPRQCCGHGTCAIVGVCIRNMSFPWIVEVCENEVSSDIEIDQGAASDPEPEIACENQDEQDIALSSGLYWTMPARVRIAKPVKIRDNGMFRRACSSPCGKESARETRIGRKPCFVQWICMNDLDFNKKKPLLARFYLKLSYFRRANKCARSWKETPNAPAKTMVLDNINAVRTRVANARLSRTSEVAPESN
ncbi:hypothetical protein GUITHDRAFT_153548 [Guillardia theta CCMP2712]|uniref:Uncharacterized protein n=1 Tax=Guillardia theta (strain CCMP2712) TaxID=905079 RepID=L1J2G8_GUITC|nr:hypothetical protein GUITHDRAFT_153548 [Guillardia theta CCMP2712]EKX42512.1 hypothetical protein GUITHDRAFT_153548 [Guillardia theta CCMP2712]|eukprot:XP_005829492.1 hypothetical protein GUITHDRAFT_153548 [Guillardia theta CCMP2712]